MTTPPQPKGTTPASKAGKGFVSVLNALFPNYCYLCGLRSDQDLPLCLNCQSGLVVNDVCCPRCALPGPAGGSALCGQCLQTPPAFDRVIAPWLYGEQMAFLLHRWKFHGERRISALLAYLWLSQQHYSTAPPDLIVPVPLHWSKLWRRGFNQSQLLCMQLQRQCAVLGGIELDARLVQRHRATPSQSTLSAAARKSNLLGAFTARQRCDNLRVAIVDDVLTTGSTATAMATTLRDAGASHIEIWCMARTPEPRD